jgi:hypothetical protein
LPFHWMVELEMKFEPTTLRVNAGPPCWELFGDIAAIEGTGFGGPVEVLPGPPLLPPPQPSKLIVPRRTSTGVARDLCRAAILRILFLSAAC